MTASPDILTPPAFAIDATPATASRARSPSLDRRLANA